MSSSHQYPSYPTQSMQQGTPSPGTPGALWRASGAQPGYPSAAPLQSPQRPGTPTYNMPQQQAPVQHASHMPPPGHPSQQLSAGQMTPQPYMSPMNQMPQAKQQHQSPAASVPHDPYRHMQPQPHSQQMQYRQVRVDSHTLFIQLIIGIFIFKLW